MPSFDAEFEGPSGSSFGVGGSFGGPDAALDGFIRDLRNSPYSTAGDYTGRVFELDSRDRRISDLPSGTRRIRIDK